MLRLAWHLAAVAVAIVGIGYRLAEFGRYGFWTDEAWVALATRVEGWQQFALAVGHTPIAWVGLLRLVPSAIPPEVGLRAIPLVFSCLSLVMAWRLGVRLARHPLGGLLAVAALALDPLAIAFAKVLKQYSAEGFFALWAVERLVAVTQGGGSVALAGLVAVLCLGVPFAGTQLFVAPPVLSALVLAAALERDWAALRRACLATVVVGLVDVLAYGVLVAPHLSPALTTYFEGKYVPAGSVGQAWSYVVAQLDEHLGNALGPFGWMAALGVMVVATVLDRRVRPLGIAVLGLAAEVVVLSREHIVPFGEPRVLVFLYAVLMAGAAASVATVAVRLSERRSLVPLLAVGLLLLAVDAARDKRWRELGVTPFVEDGGPLVRLLETSRGPDDCVLVYGRSTYTYAYYADATPVLDPAPGTTIGYSPRFDESRVVVVDATDAIQRVRDAFARSERGWFLGTRLLMEDTVRLNLALLRYARVVRTERRQNALLLELHRNAQP